MWADAHPDAERPTGRASGSFRADHGAGLACLLHHQPGDSHEPRKPTNPPRLHPRSSSPSSSPSSRRWRALAWSNLWRLRPRAQLADAIERAGRARPRRAAARAGHRQRRGGDGLPELRRLGKHRPGGRVRGRQRRPLLRRGARSTSPATTQPRCRAAAGATIVADYDLPRNVVVGPAAGRGRLGGAGRAAGRRSPSTSTAPSARRTATGAAPSASTPAAGPPSTPATPASVSRPRTSSAAACPWRRPRSAASAPSSSRRARAP